MQKLSSSPALDSIQVDVPVRPMQPIKGRGAASQITHRFARELRQGFDDGWGKSEQDGGSEVGEEVKTWCTHLEWERAKSALSRHESPDLPFHLGLNPYRGCEHGCIYCYARPSHSYLGYSPGLDFETRLIAKENLPEVLRAFSDYRMLVYAVVLILVMQATNNPAMKRFFGAACKSLTPKRKERAAL